ncbi:MAG: M48 family metalloprotease [Rhodospirillales bacterium]
MTRRIRITLFALSLIISALFLPFPSARSQERGPGERIVVIRDAETETLLREFATTLYRTVGLDTRKIRIVLVRDRAINAFVTTGNRMFIHTGLIMRADSALEVVGTMAHETGHVAHGDISRGPEIAREMMWRSLGAMLIAGAAGVASRDGGVGVGAALGGMSMAQRHYLSFSRGQEEGADSAAAAMLDRLGWSTRGLLRLFEKLDDEDALVHDRRDPFLMTHPLTRDRMNFMRRHAETGRGRELPIKLEQAYLLVRAKLDGFLSIPNSVLHAYPSSDQSEPALYARAAAEHQLSHRDAALGLMDRLIALQPANPWYREMRGQIMHETGHPREAVAAYQEAVRLAPNQPLLHQGLAQAMMETGDRSMLRSAIGQLDIARWQDPEDDSFFHLLGIAWGQLGDIGQANLALAEEAIRNGDYPLAKRFARIAAESLPQGPPKLRALDIGNAAKKENRE